MSKIIPIFILSMIIAGMYEYFSVKKENDLGNIYYICKNRICYIILTVVMAVFVGLRTSYNDTITYRNVYEQISRGTSAFAGINWLKIGENPGFNFVNHILKNVGITTQNFLMIYAIITIGIYIWFIRKYSDHFMFSIFLFITMGCYVFTMAAIKQCVAVAFCLVATDRVINKKYIRFVLWVLIASTFHAYSLMYLLIPLFTFKPWTRKSYFLLGISVFVGVSLQSLLGTVVNITTMLGEEYDISSFSGDGVNIFRVAVVWAPMLLSILARKNIQARNARDINVIVNLTMINAVIMFIGLFGTANYFARLANYFLIFQTITLPLLLNAFTKESRRIVTIIIVMCYLLYFYYATAIMYGGFDSGFNRIGIVEYVRQLI